MNTARDPDAHDLDIQLARLQHALEHSASEPCPGRADRERATAHARTFRERILPTLTAARSTLPRDEAEAAAAAVTATGAEVAALLAAAGDSARAAELLTLLESSAPAPLAAQLAAARRDPDGFGALMHGRWLLQAGRRRAARRALARAADSRAPALADAARATLDAPEPIRSAPGLFRLNGCGLGLYGHRDVDGPTYVTTHCISLLWLPVLPLAAYRVVHRGGGEYGFLARVPLSGFASAARVAVAAAVALALLGLGAKAYLDDPDRRAAAALRDAAALADRGDTEAAIAAYEAAARRFGDEAEPDTLDDAGAALATLYLADLDAATPGAADELARIARRFEGLPAAARGGDAARSFADRALAWCDQLPDGEAGQAARLRVLDAIAPLGARTNPIAAARRAASVRLGDALAADWPLAALDAYGAAGPDGVAGTGRVLAALGAQPSLWQRARPHAEAWRAASPSDADELRTEVEQRLEAAAALADDPARAAALAAEPPDSAALEALAAAEPGDQEVAVALAGLAYLRGNADAARARLIALGAAGWLIPEAQQLLANIDAETGREADAEALLTAALAHRLPRLRRARADYDRRFERVRDRAIERLEQGPPVPELEAAAEGKSQADQRSLVMAWIQERLDKDAELVALGHEYDRYADAVPMSLALGALRLRMAQSASPEAKQGLLDAAERAFLAVQDDAADLPEYHLGYGQVLYRLGRSAEGAAELDGVLALDDPQLALAVATAYRAVGVNGRAREISGQLAESGNPAVVSAAAGLRAVLAQYPGDQRHWLELADQSDPSIRIRLRDLDAWDAARRGDCDAAARHLDAVFAYYAARAERDAAAANNGAGAAANRYPCSGDRRDLERARTMLETALRLAPASPVVASNAASMYAYLDALELLDTYVNIDLLRPDQTTAATMVETLARSPLHDAIVAAHRGNRRLQRARELSEREILLAPQGTDGYRQLAAFAAGSNDLDRLRQLRDDVRGRGAALDVSGENSARAKYAAMDDDTRAMLEGRAVQAEAALVRARARGNDRTRALALMALADARARLALRDANVAVLAANIEATREAGQLWPVLRDHPDVAYALASLAIAEATATSRELAATWDAVRGQLPLALALYEATRRGQDRATVAALRARPSLAAAARIPRSAGDHGPDAWLFATLAGDDAAAAAASDWRDDELGRLEHDIARAINPGDPGTAALAALYESTAP